MRSAADQQLLRGTRPRPFFFPMMLNHISNGPNKFADSLAGDGGNRKKLPSVLFGPRAQRSEPRRLVQRINLRGHHNLLASAEPCIVCCQLMIDDLVIVCRITTRR